MVNAIPIIKGYTCQKCYKPYASENDAETCCQKKTKDWENVIKFELKQIHLDLLKEMGIDWNDCEFGAPCVDCKRPYGNSSVEDDIANIIKLPKKGNFDYEEEEWKDKSYDFMLDLHKQTQIALQIILHCQTFRLGKYKRKEKYSQKWVFDGAAEK